MVPRICIQACVRCGVALVLGVLPATVILAPSIPFEFTQAYTFSGLPSDDEALEAWIRGQANVCEVQTERSEDRRLEVRFVRRWVAAEALYPPMADFGYAGMGAGAFSSSVHYGMLLGDPFVGLVFLLAAQLGLLVVGLWWFRKARRKGRPLPAVLQGFGLRSVGYGLLVGGILVTVGLAYDAVIRLLPVELRDTAGVWRVAAGLSRGSLVVVLTFGCVAAPVCEELFFRGAVFGSFRTAGHPAIGAVFSAVLFALIHVDPANMFPLLVFGLVNAWAIHRTGSLVVPVVAHMVNNAVAFGLILS